MTSVPGGRSIARLGPPARATVARQDSVVTTRQLQEWGLSRSLVGRRVSDGEWQHLFRGVVALHSGEVGWRQRARGALLYAGEGGALSHRSAVFAHGLSGSAGPGLVVSVPIGREVVGQPGLVIHRRRRMPHAAGRLRAIGPEDSILDLSDQLTSDDELVALVCDAVRLGALPGRILLHAEGRSRLRHRALLTELLGEQGRQIESPLEHRYLRDVERRHGLPRGVGQVRERVDGRWIRADRVYVGLSVRVELDGQLAHPRGRTDEDTWRDNAVVIERADLTLRYRWRHVVVDPCGTAAQVAAALRSRGWQGRLRPCSPGCTGAGAVAATHRADLVAPGATKSAR